MDIFFIIISFLIALPVHECSHAWVAYKLGDPTAKKLGRISLNPLKHIDPLGGLLVFFAGFGWGKPVPVDARYFKHGKRDNALVSFAGPLSNIVLALFGLIAMKYFFQIGIPFDFLKVFISLNITLAVFNLLPIPPLDGGHIFEFFLPESLHDTWYEFQKIAPFILIAVLLAEHFFHIGILTKIIGFFTDLLYVFLYTIT